MNNSERKVKKYRPITQSYYGVYHHKKTDLPIFKDKSDQIRRRTLLLNQCSLEPNNPATNQASEGLKQYSTIDVINDYRNNLLDQNIITETNQVQQYIEEHGHDHLDDEQSPLILKKKPTSLEIMETLYLSIVDLKADFKSCLDVKTFVTYLPAIMLGTLLNVLNAVSYGIIIFPTEIGVYSDFGTDGISMLLVSSATSQIFCAIFSVFKGSCGGFMLEIIPFLHIMCKIIIEDVGISNSDKIVATTMAAYGLSALLTGVIFMLLGVFRMGFLAGFFPRHILVGCIGGVGYFLLVTSLEVASNVKLQLNLSSLQSFFAPEKVYIWATCIVLALVLKLMQRKISSPVLIPAFYFSIPVVFFFVTFMFGIDNDTLVEKGWMFSTPNSSDKPFYNYLTRYDFLNVSWSTIPKLFSTMAALIFFGVLHVPINVPAVGVTIKQDNIDVNQELISHGLANLVTGCLGTVQNYLTYSSSVLFIKSGGTNRFAGLLMGLAVYMAWFIGPGIIRFLPILVIGSLIFHLGVELLKEGVYETYGVMNRVEYSTVWAIIASMAIFGFVEGVFVGIVLACVFFVILYSNGTSPIRSSYSGIQTRSTVRRNFKQRDFLDKLSDQTHVIKLQGFLFFGTINIVENSIKKLLNNNRNPIRFLVLDLTLATGLDFSAGEAFIRIRRLLKSKQTYFCICGVTLNSEISYALTAVGIWESEANDTLVKTFFSLNDTLEWCENYYVEKTLNKAAFSQSTANDVQDANSNVTPRTTMVNTVANEILTTEPASYNLPQPASLLFQIFQHLKQKEVLLKMSEYFKEKKLKKGEEVWRQNEVADRMFIVANGLLKASYKDPASKKVTQVESIIPGSMIGELAMFTNKKRSFTIVAEAENTILFEFNANDYKELKTNNPALILEFMQVALGYSAVDMGLYTLLAFNLE